MKLHTFLIVMLSSLVASSCVFAQDRQIDLDLLQAIKEKDGQGVCNALRSGANPNFQPENAPNTTPLAVARRYFLSILPTLVDAGADVNMINAQGETLLASLLIHGRPSRERFDGIAALLAAGADPRLELQRPVSAAQPVFNPLATALMQGDHELALLLLEHGAMYSRHQLDNLPMHEIIRVMLVAPTEFPAVVGAMKARGPADFELQSALNKAFALAAAQDELSMVNEIWEVFSEEISVGSLERALTAAAMRGSRETFLRIFALLYEKYMSLGMSVEAITEDILPKILRVAIMNGRTDIVLVLRSAGVDAIAALLWLDRNNGRKNIPSRLKAAFHEIRALLNTDSKLLQEQDRRKKQLASSTHEADRLLAELKEVVDSLTPEEREQLLMDMAIADSLKDHDTQSLPSAAMPAAVAAEPEEPLLVAPRAPGNVIGAYDPEHPDFNKKAYDELVNNAFEWDLDDRLRQAHRELMTRPVLPRTNSFRFSE